MATRNSPILFLIICSNTKEEGGSRTDYDRDSRIWGSLAQESEGVAQDLYRARSYVRNLISQSNEARRDGRPLKALRFNQNLKDGPDFSARGINPVGGYLPAVQRYDGRFFKALGKSEERLSLLTQTNHHVLIVSGLYGLLLPEETIQLYSCHVPDHPMIAERWRQNRLLTLLLETYIRKFRIERIFELMADDDYRHLLDWAQVRQAVQGELLHGVSDAYAGPAQLDSFGLLMADLLSRSSEELLGIKDGAVIAIDGDAVRLTKKQTPLRPGSGVNRLDNMARMRGNINTILNTLYGPADPGVGFNARVNALIRNPRPGGKLDGSVGGQMQQFNKKRNDIEYGGHLDQCGRTIVDEDWDYLVDRYLKIFNWARDSEGFAVDRLEAVDMHKTRY
jgi:cytoplasmic iron level regulating protein YaaA (DUF328/UPF0246 family)